MRLRLKLGLLIAATIIPFTLAIAWYQGHARERAFAEGTAEQLVQRMTAGERLVCERRPQRWPEFRRFRRPRAGPRQRRLALPLSVDLWAYDGGFQSQNPDAPPFPADLQADLAGADVASAAAPGAGPGSRWVAVRMPWSGGPCAVVLVKRVDAPRALTARSLLPTLLIAMLATLIAVVVAGTVVRRIRRLTYAVRHSEKNLEGEVEIAGSDEIAELARAFAELRAQLRARLEELGRRDQALRDYIADTNHDVMIPLTVLQGHLGAVERDLPANAEAARARLVDAQAECHYVASLLHNLNASAKLDAGALPLDRHPLDLNQIVERVASRHAPLAKRKRVGFNHAVPDAPTKVLGDTTLLEQALGNLVHNAIRYNHLDGNVAFVLETDRGWFQIRVVDDGPGLDEEELLRLGERGFRSDAARTRQPSGHGLGISIAKEVVEKHGFALTFGHPEAGGLEAVIEGPVTVA